MEPFSQALGNLRRLYSFAGRAVRAAASFATRRKSCMLHCPSPLGMFLWRVLLPSSAQ